MSVSVPMEVDVATVKKWLIERKDWTLIDCREPHEAEIASIPGATLIPMSQLSQATDQLEGLKGRHIVVHCHHGGRSLRVTQWLRGIGFPDAQNMAGGIDAWSTEVDSSVPRY